jgi:O-antigen biosynthesis protein WbqL
MVTEIVPIQTEFDFGAGGNGFSCLVSGWGIQEKKWVWSVEPISILRLPRPEFGRGINCHVTLMPFVRPPQLMRQRLTISVNSIVCFDDALQTAGAIVFTIPSAALQNAANLDIEFQVPDCTAPLAVGAGTDSRTLGVACLHLTLVTDAPQMSEPELPKSHRSVYAGRAEPHFIDATNVSTFANGERDERLLLFPAMSGPAQIPMHDESSFDANFVAQHYRNPPTSDVCAYALRDSCLWGNGFITIGERFFLQPDCMPGYFDAYLRSDRHEFPLAWTGPMNHEVELVKVSDVCGVVIHPNLIYGHFLLECLPKLYLLSLLRDLGVRFQLPLSSCIPDWVRALVALYVDESDILYYDKDRQYISASSFIIPSMLHTEHNFHPAFNLMVADTLRRAGITPRQREPGSAVRIYLSRRKFRSGWHKLRNEDEVEQVMERLGFAIVHPQLLSIREQLRLMASADVIAGEYGSALHNAMFSRAGTKIISLNCINWYQSMIGRLRRHRVAFVPPADGYFRTWRERHEGAQGFSIDLAQLERVVRDVISENISPS